MWLLVFYWCVSLLNPALASDVTSQQNDIIPDQPLEIPDGMFCYFTMSELMFTDKMQQVASSAYRVGAARLSDINMVSATGYGYNSLWGAFFFVQREDYSNIIEYAKSQNTVVFVSTMEVESIENESGICVMTDMGLQPNTYPSTMDCSQCYGSGGSSNQPSMSDYQQELASMGVPASYFQAMGNLPTMQSPSGGPSGQMQEQSPTASLGGSVSGPTPSLGASAQGNLSPNPSLGGSGQIPPLGASAQGNLSANPSLGASAQIPPLGASAQGNVQTPPTGFPGAGSSGGVYQPRTNFSGSLGGSGNQQQPTSSPGFTFASYSGQYSFLSAQGGNSFMN